MLSPRKPCGKTVFVPAMAGKIWISQRSYGRRHPANAWSGRIWEEAEQMMQKMLGLAVAATLALTMTAQAHGPSRLKTEQSVVLNATPDEV